MSEPIRVVLVDDHTLFRMGLAVSPKNIFPSNIQGLPTWYEVRISDAGYIARRDGIDLERHLDDRRRIDGRRRRRREQLFDAVFGRDGSLARDGSGRVRWQRRAHGEETDERERNGADPGRHSLIDGEGKIAGAQEPRHAE